MGQGEEKAKPGWFSALSVCNDVAIAEAKASQPPNASPPVSCSELLDQLSDVMRSCGGPVLYSD
jgi:hypothetical protein